ncbi:hypothetical protein T439DRAFT_98556 [Meredithblackwellia eburnea MCA 4105]
MKFRTSLLAAVGALSTFTSAQAPANSTICDYYTTALTKNNTAANQYLVLTLLVNTAVIGSYSPLANASVKVPGILNPNGTYMGQSVNLVPYFSGQFNSTNGGGSTGVSKNFLDGGGAAPLMNNTPANDQTSNQYFLLTHLYEFFGLLLGCSEVGMGAFPAYGGNPSMYEVHKFMVLDAAEMGYFITQVALAAQSFGVAAADIAKVGTALNSVFNVKCAPATNATGTLAEQSICTGNGCPLAPNSNCTGQGNITAPVGAIVHNATTTGTGTSTNASGTAKPSGSGSASATAKAGVGRVEGSVAGLVGAVLFGLGLLA